MRALFVIILLAALIPPSGHASASPSIEISAKEQLYQFVALGIEPAILDQDGGVAVGDGANDLQTLQAQAAQGDANAQYTLGVMYDFEKGVPQNFATAKQWYEKAAAQGHAGAQTNLGVLYDNGHGAPQDYGKARQWYEKAAAQGNAEAQYKLGGLHLFARGVPQDYVQAAKWYEKAAVQGNAGAQNDLGTLYGYGQGVPLDYVRAYMWLNVAAAHLTGDEQKFVAVNRDYVARHMTPAQIAEAQRLAQQCQARKFKGC